MNCLNCKATLEESNKFCPNCGQQVDGNNLKLRALFREFFENYLSFDTRVGRTIIPFFFKPGKLTQDFNEGKRKNYANPFRLYILCSLIFFSALSLNIVKVNDIIKVSPNELSGDIELSDNQIDSLNFFLSKTLKSKVDSIDSLNFKRIYNELQFEEKIELLDKLKNLKQLESNSKIDKLKDSLKPEIKDNQKSFLGKFDWLYLNKNRYDNSLTDSAIYNHMNLGENSYLLSRTYYQIIKIYRSDQKTFAKFLFKNFSFAMFFLVPLSAFILMIFFGWKRQYVEYLIYSIHVHSLLFFLGGIASFLIYIFSFSNTVLQILKPSIFIYGAAYFLIGLNRLYKKGILKTIIYAFLSLLLYILVFVIISIIEFYTSLLLF